MILGKDGVAFLMGSAPQAEIAKHMPAFQQIFDSVKFDSGREFRPAVPPNLVARISEFMGGLLAFLLVCYVLYRLFRRPRPRHDLGPPVT
jgi:hypothetical protein